MQFLRNDNDLSIHCQALIASAAELKKKFPDQFRELFLIDSPVIISRPIKNKFGWMVLPDNTAEFNIPKLALFHNLIEHHCWASCSFDEFNPHFIDPEKSCGDPIVWMGDVMILVYLFYVLINDKKVIPAVNSLYDVLCQHFVLLDKKTNTIKKLSRGSLRTSLSNANSDPDVCKIVKNFLFLLLS